MSSHYSFDILEPTGPELEDTELYQLITTGTKSSIREAWRHVGQMRSDDVRLRSTKDRGGYLHVLVNMASKVNTSN